MKLLTVFGIVVGLLVLILGGGCGVAKAFRHFGVSGDAAFFIAMAVALISVIVLFGAMLVLKEIV